MKISPRPLLCSLAFLLLGLAPAEPETAAPSRIKRVPVASSNVASIGYSRQLHALEIEFVRGAVYRFLQVPPRVHRQLLAAKSKGHFIAENIRGRYQFIRIRPGRREPDAEGRPGEKKK